MPGPTNTDPGADRWPIGDDLLRLREWATERSQALPTTPGDQWIIGSDPTCWMQLKDETGRVSRRHAAVLRKEGKWILRDLGSKNGIVVDGKLCEEVVLEPGLEVWIGGVTLVAESGRLVALRMFLSRLLGWTSDRVRVVDLAMRSIRTAAMHQVALVLCGDDDLVQLARALHRHIFGHERPFVLCDRSRVRSEDPARGVWNYQLGREALPTAKHGSLCVWNNKPPRDFADVKRVLQDPDTRVQLIVCARHANEAEAFGATPIAIPDLRHRALELPRIIEEYGHDATEQLGLPARSFMRADRDLVLAHAASTLGEIEKATLRLLAIREAGGNLNRAAERLGMARPPLTKWIERRGLPIRVHERDE